MENVDSTGSTQSLVFQDVMERHLSSGRRNEQEDTCHYENDLDRRLADSDDNDDRVSLAFFELANTPEVAYRIPSKKRVDKQSKKRKRKSESETSSLSTEEAMLLRFHQDTSACLHHTGGIIWETSVLLLQYLLNQSQEKQTDFVSLGNVLEVGAGCGLLGQGLAACLTPEQCRYVIQTETAQVLGNLEANLQKNISVIDCCRNSAVRDLSKPRRIRACALDWTRYQEDAQDAKLAVHSFDTVLGTDVIFNPDLVEPLLETLAYLCKKPNGVVYICVQERCAASHAHFLQRAPECGFEVQELTSELGEIPSCQWGLAVECHLYRLIQQRSKEKAS